MPKVVPCVAAICLHAGLLFAQLSTNPRNFVHVTENPPHGAGVPMLCGNREADERSTLTIEFDESRMQPGAIQILVSADLLKGKSSIPVVPVDNYVSKGDDKNPVVIHPKDLPNASSVVPDTQIDLHSIAFGDSDYLELRVKNLYTAESAVYTVTPQPFGFRRKVSDSLLLLKRRGVGDGDRKNGVDDVNFSPAPGVTYGGTFLARRNDFVRFVRPGVGVNVSFMNWKDPAYDVVSGKLAPGAKTSDIQIGLGAVFSLFNDALQFTYGANLHANQDRLYWGVGVSFVNLASKLAGLVR